MTGKERVKAATRFETVDRVPTTLLDGGTWIVNQAGCSFDELMAMEDGGAQIVYDCYQKLNSDIVFAGVGCFGMGIRALGGSCDASKRGQPIDVSNLSSDIDFYANYDLSTIRPKLLSDPGIQGVVRQTRRLRELIGDDKYISTNTGAPFSNAAMLWGLQDFMMDLFSDETDLTPLFRFATAANLELNRIMLEAGANMVELGDPVASGALISQDMYEELSGFSAVKLNEKTDFNTLKTVHKGAFVISLRSFQGGFEYSEYEGVVSPAYQVFYPTIPVYDGYYKYLFKTQIFIDKMNSYTMSLRDGKNIAFGSPPGVDRTEGLRL